MNEKLVVNRNAKQAVQSASFNAQENREPGLSRTRLTYPVWQEKTCANRRRSRKQKKALTTIEKPRNQKFEKASEEGSDSYGTPYSNSDSPTSEKRRVKQNNGKITKIEEKLLKTKYSDKGPVLIGL